MVGVVVEDEAIRLRPVTLEDVDPWLAGKDEEQIRWFEFPRPARRQDVLQAVQRWQASWRQGGPVRHWAIVDRNTDLLAGGVEVRDLSSGEVNLSYLVFPSFRQRGFATRASRLALDMPVEKCVPQPP
jgi:RimJ/RimL family protein N-acetyltransferase